MTPQTEAGRRLRERGWFAAYPDQLADAIAAIEAEARAKGRLHALLADEGDIEQAAAGAVLAERARLAEAVRGLRDRWQDRYAPSEWEGLVGPVYAAVLALLEPGRSGDDD